MEVDYFPGGQRGGVAKRGRGIVPRSRGGLDSIRDMQRRYHSPEGIQQRIAAMEEEEMRKLYGGRPIERPPVAGKFVQSDRGMRMLDRYKGRRN